MASALPALPTAPDICAALQRVLDYSSAREFSGYSKFDALNSSFLEIIFGWHWVPRLLITQAVNRCWFHVRPLLGVRQSRNPKGIANFIKAYANRYQLNAETADRDCVKALADWLLDNHADPDGRYHGLCWGYNFPWQSPGFYAPRHFPNCIVTVFCAEGLLKAFAVTGNTRYREAARSAADFILKDLPVLEESAERKCIGYVPAILRWKVININAVAAGFLATLAQITGEPSLTSEARRMIRWVVDHRVPGEAWPYTAPAETSGIGYDNYHTGGILDGLYDYMHASGDATHKTTYREVLNFYRRNLFLDDGTARLFSDRTYPVDIHSVAQGILTFVKAAALDGAYLDFARRIVAWGIRHMQDADGHFYYRKHHWFTRKECMMRWNNSWMAWALSELCLVEKR